MRVGWSDGRRKWLLAVIVFSLCHPGLPIGPMVLNVTEKIAVTSSPGQVTPLILCAVKQLSGAGGVPAEP